MKTPPFLRSGDKIALVAPARKILRDEISKAVSMIEQRGFEPVFDERLFAENHQYAGDDALRAQIFQERLDDAEIKAILFVRGGYGGLRIVDKLCFDTFIKQPKWLVGYSDSTVFHGKLQQIGFESLHATMPINFDTNTKQAINSLFDALEGKPIEYCIEKHELNKTGTAEAPIVGGNLSVLYSMLGSEIFPDTRNKILFIEDLDEYLYHIDRMVLALKRAGIFKNLSALVVGGMTTMRDNAIPFGKTAEQIIAEHVSEYDFPVCFGFPAGHFDNNKAFVLGAETHLEVTKSGVLFKESRYFERSDNEIEKS
ncbi:MAG: LD-carboxypeptidase [Lentimicrobiaceae bacterium]|jgi:muramoyltetrapeptide carboxypeptidase|nr:LD-carboxypeptidase [Lentimicrobiaceae bacterium]